MERSPNTSLATSSVAALALGAFVLCWTVRVWPFAAGSSALQKGAGSVTCRTYPTSVTNISVTGASTTTLTSSGTYNPTTHQMTYNVTYSGTGARHSYTQVSTYRSTADVVDEVQVIPPRTLSTGSVGAGGLSFTLTNSYDAQRRLTGFTNASGGTVETTTYSSWDSSGRPTAGTSSSTGALRIAYDDASRTATTTLVGRGTQVQTFDADGNPAVLVQTYGTGVSRTTTKVGSTAQVCK